MNDKEIKELLKHEYPEFDNKGNEIYELVSNKRKRPFFTRKMILMPVASVIITLLVVLVFTFSGNKGFKKICDGVYVSASTLDLSGEVDMSICEGIVEEPRNDLIVILEKEHSGAFSNMWGFRHPLYFKFPEKGISYYIYDNNFSYMSDNHNNSIYQEDDYRYIVWNRFEDWLNITQNLSNDEVDDLLEQYSQYYVLIAIKKNKENYGYIILEINAYYVEVNWNLTTKIEVIKSVIFPKIENKNQKVSNEQVIALFRKVIENREEKA